MPGPPRGVVAVKSLGRGKHYTSFNVWRGSQRSPQYDIEPFIEQGARCQMKEFGAREFGARECVLVRSLNIISLFRERRPVILEFGASELRGTQKVPSP